MTNWIEEVKALPDDELALVRTLVEQETRRRQEIRNQESKVWKRCLTCNGTGKHFGGYCTCQTGFDLRRLEVGDAGVSYDVQPEGTG